MMACAPVLSCAASATGGLARAPGDSLAACWRAQQYVRLGGAQESRWVIPLLHARYTLTSLLLTRLSVIVTRTLISPRPLAPSLDTLPPLTHTQHTRTHAPHSHARTCTHAGAAADPFNWLSSEGPCADPNAISLSFEQPQNATEPTLDHLAAVRPHCASISYTRRLPPLALLPSPSRPESALKGIVRNINSPDFPSCYFPLAQPCQALQTDRGL
jgi:hypothetical protein